jgi:hypothetical protein
LFNNLKHRLLNAHIELLDHKRSIDELKRLETKQLPSGAFSITAPPGGSDDCACALALTAYQARSHGSVLGNITSKHLFRFGSANNENIVRA